MIRPPVFCVDHRLGGALQAEEHALGVDPVDAVPIRLGQIHDVAEAGDAGIVDDDVDAAELGDDARHHRVDAGDIAAIGLDRQRRDCRRHRLAVFCAAARSMSAAARIAPSFAMRERDGAADPGAGAGHQRDFVLQDRHAFSPAARHCGRRSDEAIRLERGRYLGRYWVLPLHFWSQ